MDKTKILYLLAIFVGQISWSQKVFVETEVSAAFFSVLKDLRNYNICLEENLGKEAIAVIRDDKLPYIAIADGFQTEGVIGIRYSHKLLEMPFKEQKFIFLHEISHHAGFYHQDAILAVKAYSESLPYYYEIALGQLAIILADSL